MIIARNALVMSQAQDITATREHFFAEVVNRKESISHFRTRSKGIHVWIIFCPGQF
jgi:hypothetical protein